MLERQIVKTLFFEHVSNTRQPAWLLVEQNFVIVHMTSVAKSILAERDGLEINEGKLRIGDYRASKKVFLDMLAMHLTDSNAPSNTTKVKRISNKADYIIQTYPAISRNFDIDLSGYALINIIDPAQSIKVDLNMLQKIYKLSHREAQIAIAIVNGQNLHGIAKDNGVAVGTVRNQLKSVLHKTNTTSQSKLVSLLAKLASI